MLELCVNLQCNRAMVYLRLHEYIKAEEACTTILEDYRVTTSTKAWYRRAMAREGRAKLCREVESRRA